MAKPNYSYEKRQRELAKKKKKEEKLARKAHGKPEGGEGGAEEATTADDMAEQPAGEEATAAPAPVQPAA